MRLFAFTPFAFFPPPSPKWLFDWKRTFSFRQVPIVSVKGKPNIFAKRTKSRNQFLLWPSRAERIICSRVARLYANYQEQSMTRRGAKRIWWRSRSYESAQEQSKKRGLGVLDPLGRRDTRKKKSKERGKSNRPKRVGGSLTRSPQAVNQPTNSEWNGCLTPNLFFVLTCAF